MSSPPRSCPARRRRWRSWAAICPAANRLRAGSIQDRVLDLLTVPFQAPKEDVLLQRFTSVNHFPSPNLNARGMQFYPAELPGALNPATVVFADAPVTLEQEPNDTPETAQPITLPTVVCGRLDKPGDADWYTFTGQGGRDRGRGSVVRTPRLSRRRLRHLLRCQGHRGWRPSTITASTSTPWPRPIAIRSACFGPRPTGTYKIFVQERYRNGGPRYQYVLKLTPVVPDFYPGGRARDAE